MSEQQTPRSAVVVMRRSHLRREIAAETLEQAVKAGRISQAERVFIETGVYNPDSEQETR